MDKMKNVHAKHRISGLVATVPEDQLDHPVLGANLERVRSPKKRGRLSDIVKDVDSASAHRVTNVATPDKDKED